MDTRNTRPAKAFLIGAGPGDPDLICLRAVQCVRQADLVLADYLVNPIVFDHVPASVEIVRLGHHGTGRIMPQEEINARMIDAARSGKTVVRLKGGDPSVFGRAADEIEALTGAGIPLEVVPGVTAALAATEYAQIPLAGDGQSGAVALVTGHQRDAKGTPPLRYGTLANFPGTLVFYMGVTTAADWSRELIAAGKPPETPVLIVRRATLPDQQTLRCALESVAPVIAEKKLRPPAVIFVGPGIDRAPTVSWFTARPLFGTRVLVTGATDECRPLYDRLRELGADVLIRPVTRVRDPSDWQRVDAALDRLDDYDWLIFSDNQTVGHLLGRLFQTGRDVRHVGRLKLAAGNSATADALLRFHLRVDIVGGDRGAESFASMLVSEAVGRRFLLAQESGTDSGLHDHLATAGGTVDEIAVCSRQELESADAELITTLGEGQIDWVTATDPANAAALVRLFGQELNRVKLASIDSATSEILRGLGHEPAVEATEPSLAGLAQAMAEGR
jgi:uroporphyrinogen III methyltransferase/synthase